MVLVGRLEVVLDFDPERPLGEVPDVPMQAFTTKPVPRIC